MRAIALIAMLALAAVVGTAAATGDEREQPPSAGHGSERAPAISQEAKDAVRTLASARDGDDAIPAHLAKPLRDRAPFGANPDLSRLAIAQASQSLYLVPGTDHVCLALTSVESDGWTIVCPTIAELAAGRAGPMTVGLPGGALMVAGVVPDGVDAVRVRDGVDPAIPVESNAYYRVFAAGETPRALSYEGPDGPVTWELANPHAFDRPEQ